MFNLSMHAMHLKSQQMEHMFLISLIPIKNVSEAISDDLLRHLVVETSKVADMAHNICALPQRR